MSRTSIVLNSRAWAAVSKGMEDMDFPVWNWEIQSKSFTISLMLSTLAVLLNPLEMEPHVDLVEPHGTALPYPPVDHREKAPLWTEVDPHLQTVCFANYCFDNLGPF